MFKTKGLCILNLLSNSCCVHWRVLLKSVMVLHTDQRVITASSVNLWLRKSMTNWNLWLDICLPWGVENVQWGSQAAIKAGCFVLNVNFFLQNSRRGEKRVWCGQCVSHNFKNMLPSASPLSTCQWQPFRPWRRKIQQCYQNLLRAQQMPLMASKIATWWLAVQPLHFLGALFCWQHQSLGSDYLPLLPE